jgi:hypothetical protein
MKEMLGRSEFICAGGDHHHQHLAGSCAPRAIRRLLRHRLRDARHHTLEALAFTFPLMVVAVLLKMLLVAVVPSIQGQPILQMFAEPAPGASRPSIPG